MKRSYEKEMMDLAEPVTGEGIYLALRIGQLAASAIAVAIGEANLSSARVAAYGRNFRAEFGAQLRLNSLICGLVYRPSCFVGARAIEPAAADPRFVG